MLDPTLVHHLRTTINYVVEDEFFAAAANLKYQRFTKILPTDTLVEIKAHRIAGAVYEDFGETGGGVRYEDTVIGSQEFRNHYAKSGYKIPEGEFNDFNGKGIPLAADWAKDVGYAGGYWPQRRAIQVLRNGTSTSMITENGNVVKLVCYDGKALFATDHPYNFKRTGLGTFSNLLTNETPMSSTYPGFLPLGGPYKYNAVSGAWEYSASDSVSKEDALANLFKVIAHVKSIKMPDGITPRYLEPTCIIFGPKLQENVLTITTAQFIAASSTGGGGSQEIKGVVVKLGLSEPVMLEELAGLGTVEEYDWYLTCEPQIARSQFGLICYGNLEPFNVHLYAATSGSEGINLQLAESNMVHLISQGRNFVGPGLPQYGFKIQAPR
jgi:hypothetical protein